MVKPVKISWKERLARNQAFEEARKNALSARTLDNPVGAQPNYPKDVVKLVSNASTLSELFPDICGDEGRAKPTMDMLSDDQIGILERRCQRWADTAAVQKVNKKLANKFNDGLTQEELLLAEEEKTFGRLNKRAEKLGKMIENDKQQGITRPHHQDELRTVQEGIASIHAARQERADAKEAARLEAEDAAQAKIEEAAIQAKGGKKKGKPNGYDTRTHSYDA